MAKRMRNALILAKIESPYGTDAAPTGAANAMLVKGIAPQPLSGEFVDRDLVKPYLGGSEQLLASVHSECEFEVEIAGSGDAGTAPAWAPLLKACGFGETITADTDAVYKPITDSIPSVTIYYFLDGLRHKITGARGTVALGLSPKGIPTFKFKFLGIYNEPTDTANPTDADFDGFLTPLVVNTINTPTWALHGYTGNLAELSIDIANDVIYRELIGASSVEITNRKPTASISFELGAVAAKNWAKTITDGTTGALTITHGSTAGNIVKIDAPKAQLFNPSYRDQDGTAMLSLSMSLVPNAGNDELVITVK